ARRRVQGQPAKPLAPGALSGASGGNEAAKSGRGGYAYGGSRLDCDRPRLAHDRRLPGAPRKRPLIASNVRTGGTSIEQAAASTPGRRTTTYARITSRTLGQRREDPVLYRREPGRIHRGSTQLARLAASARVGRGDQLPELHTRGRC